MTMVYYRMLYNFRVFFAFPIERKGKIHGKND